MNAPRLKALRRPWRQIKLFVLAASLLVTSAAVVACPYFLSPLVQPLTGTGAPARFAVYTPLSQISQPMQDATVAMEDGHFYHHHGFDWQAIRRAFRVDWSEGRIAQGGSTITQQLAKNLFLTKDRTVIRKLEEAAYTVEMERMLPKHRILELYLNTIDYGMVQHGITAAAAYYFHTTPAKLTLTQSALLVGMVPDPPQPDPNLAQQGEAQYEDLQKLNEGEQTALSRIAFFFPGKYSDAQIEQAQVVPLDHVIYPYRDAYDRGATQTIPAVWHGVDFYFFADPDDPVPVTNVAACLVRRLAPFLDEARAKYGVIGIDNLGAYNDRLIRGSHTAVSAHAYGQAIDISGFRFRDGTDFQVKDHADPKVLSRLAPLESLLKKHFDLVIDWRDDPVRHQTHFHCEVKGPRPIEPSPQQIAQAAVLRRT